MNMFCQRLTSYLMSNGVPVPGYVVRVGSALGADLCSKASGGVAGIWKRKKIVNERNTSAARYREITKNIRIEESCA